MFDLALTPRLRTLGLGLALGLAVAALAWAILETGSVDRRRLQTDQLELDKLKTPSRPPSILASLVSDALAHPLFILTTGPGAQPEPVIQISGISRTPAHTAALLSIDGGAFQWLNAGRSVAGITLLDVQGSKVVLETAFGRREIALDDPGPSGPASSSTAQAHAPGSPTPGVRLPPEPASARASP